MKKFFSKLLKFFKARHPATLLGVAILILGLAITPSLIKANRAKQKEKYQTVRVEKQEIIQTVSASGAIKAEKQVTLKFQTSGKLAWVGVKEGDWVKKWQAIASLDKHDLERDLLKELRDYSKERNDFEEEYRVTYREQTPQTALTDTVKRILEKNQWDLDKAVADVEIAHEAKKLAVLVAPIEGIMIAIGTPVAGINITPAQATFTIASPEVMKFVANVDEADVGQVELDQTVEILLDAYSDQTFNGKVTEIAFSAVTTSGGGTAFPVTISLPENTNQRFKVGMNGDAEIIINQKTAALTLPFSAIREKNGQKFVLTIDEKEVEITTGLESATLIEIVSGLEEGQQVIK